MKNDDVKNASFAELMGEFDAVGAQFDSVQLDIEQAIELHTRATVLIKEMEKRLKQAEASIKKA